MIFYLAAGSVLPEDAGVKQTMSRWDWSKYQPALLITYPYVANYRNINMHFPRPRKLMLDSGAFSAWQKHMEIDIDALIAEIRGGGWDEAVALDSIGNPAQSLKNSIRMKEAGVNVIPVFHYGEDWEMLAEYQRHFRKVGLSCRFGEPLDLSHKWVEQCYARGWPHLYHSFGWTSERIVMEYPWHSVDSSTWTVAPRKFGNWSEFGKMSVRRFYDQRDEVEYAWRLERKANRRWSKVYATDEWQKMIREYESMRPEGAEKEPVNA